MGEPANHTWKADWELYQERRGEKARHLAALHLSRAWLSMTPDERRAVRPDVRIEIISRTHAEQEAAPTVAFLSTFTTPGTVYCLPLKEGLNRVGKDPAWGDHDRPPSGVRVMEARQWILVCRPPLALVADDHSTNGSMVFPENLDRAAGVEDPRYSGEPYSYSALFQRPVPGRVDLDWHGNRVHEVQEGDVLLTAYAGFVFGWVSQGGSRE
jgi:hypothetical protein